MGPIWKPFYSLSNLQGKVSHDLSPLVSDDHERQPWHRDLGTNQSIRFRVDGKGPKLDFLSAHDISHGILRLAKGSLNYERTKKVEFTVTVTDVGGINTVDHHPLSRSQIITVNVLNVNEKPFSPDFSYCVVENVDYSEIGGNMKKGFTHTEIINWPKCISTGTHLVSTDEDDGDVQSLTYALIDVFPVDEDTDSFKINKNNGLITVECRKDRG